LMGNTGVPADENVVRSTATPALVDAPAAVQSSPPEFNEPAETDENPALGMVNRTLASHWVEGVQTAPFWGPEVNAQWEHNALIDRQVSSSGTAAQREAAGEFGHGTASYAVGIEPTSDLREGGRMSNEYFAANDRTAQEGVTPQMEVPPGYDQAATAAAAQAGKTAAREAAASPYDLWWKAGQ
jgi:hypothetical protein